MLKLYFTKDEMRDFLVKEGYIIKSVKTWTSYNTYHNQVDGNQFNVDVAVKDSNEFQDLDKEYNFITIDKYQIETVFQQEIKSKLLSL
jgi:hypothetical protein